MLNSPKNGEKPEIRGVKLSNTTTTKQRTSSRIPGNASITHELTTENAELTDEIDIMDKSDILDCGGPGRDAGVSGVNGSERELTDRSESLF